MSFTLNGSIIQQTGTDTDLSGLSSVTGVTVTTLDAAQGTIPARTLYDTGSYRLEIQGTLTHDPSKEILKIDGGSVNDEIIRITSTGTYNYGVETTFEGGTHYSRGEGLIIRAYLSGTLRQWRASTAGIRNQGQFNWKGGMISSGRSLISDGGDIYVREGIFKPWATSLTQKDYCPRIGFENGDVDIDGLEVYGHEGHFFGFALASDTTTNFTNVRVQGTTINAAAIAADLLGTDAATKPHATIDNVSSLADGNRYSGRAWQNRVNTWTNYGGGVALKDELSDTTNKSSAGSRGIVIAQKQVEPTVVDTAGTLLADVKVLIKEESDGNEPTYAFLNAYNDTDITHYSSARSQIKTTNASGVTAQFITGLVICYKTAVNQNMSFNVKTIGGGNEQTTRQFGYNYLLNEGRVNLAGTGVLEPTFTMIQDITVSQSTKATVDAYSTLETPQKLYDRAKSYLYDNWAGEGDLLCTRSGTDIDLGNNSLVIDATAAQAISVSGTTITIKATTFTGNITTGTGTITETNGAQVAGTVTDVNGTRSTSTLTLTGLKANTEVRVYDSSGTEVGGVENSGTSESFALTVSSVDVVIHALGYLNQRIDGLATTTNVTLPISQVLDRQYNNP